LIVGNASFVDCRRAGRGLNLNNGRERSITMDNVVEEERVPSAPAEWTPTMHELYLVFRHDDALPFDLRMVAREGGFDAFGDILADSIGFAEGAAEREKKKANSTGWTAPERGAPGQPARDGVDWDGSDLTGADFDQRLAEHGVKPSTFWSRIDKLGRDLERALYTPTRRYTPRRRVKAEHAK
jgi:hypothetical protein